MSDQRLIEYIRGAQGTGKTKEEIFGSLIATGNTVEAIQSAFASLSSAAQSSAVTKEGASVAQKEDGEEPVKKANIVGIVTMLGAIFIGVGVFSFIAGNWQIITRPTKLAIILFFMILSYAGGYFAELRSREKTASALYLLGSLIYGGGIFLVAQMFHIRAAWPDGFLLWMIGVLALAFALDSRPLYILAVPLAIVAVVGHPFGIINTWGGGNAFLMTSSFLLVASATFLFYAGYTMHKRLDAEILSRF